MPWIGFFDWSRYPQQPRTQVDLERAKRDNQRFQHGPGKRKRKRR